MPGYKGHTIGGVLAGGAYIATVTAVRPQTITDTANILSHSQMVGALVLVSVLFGLFPDIDTNSKGQNIFYGAGFIADIALLVTGHVEAAAFLGLIAMTPVLSHHRGWTHSKLAMILVPSALLIAPYFYRPELLHIALLAYGAAVVGYFSHLLLDGCIVRWIHFKGGGAYSSHN